MWSRHLPVSYEWVSELVGGNGEALINDGEENLGREEERTFFLNSQPVLIRTVKNINILMINHGKLWKQTNKQTKYIYYTV